MHAFTHLRRAVMLSQSGRDRESLAEFAEAAAGFEELHNRTMLVTVEQGWLVALEALAEWDEMESHCSRVLALTEGPELPRPVLIARLSSLFQSAGIALRRDDHDRYLVVAQEGATLARRLSEPAFGCRFELGLGTILQARQEYAAAADAYSRGLELLPAARRGPGGQVLADEELEAGCHFERASCLDRSGGPSLERAAGYVRAAELYDSSGNRAAASQARFLAGRALEMQLDLGTRDRERALLLFRRAADGFAALGEWPRTWLAEFHAVFLLLTAVKAPSEPPDRRLLPMARRSVRTAVRAGRRAEEATSRMMVALITATSVPRRQDAWLPASIVALRAHEIARPTYVIPYKRQFSDRMTAMALNAIAGRVAEEPEATRSAAGRWGELIWRLEQAKKGRSFQDEQSAAGAWRSLLSRDEAIRRLSAEADQLRNRIEEISPEARLAVVGGLGAGPEASSLRQLELARQQLDDAERSLNARMDELAQAGGIDFEFASISPPSMADVQACLRPGEAFIGYLSAGTLLSRVMLTHAEALPIETLNVWRSEQASRLLDRTRTLLDERPAEGAAAEFDVDLTELLLHGVPANVHTIVLSPDGQLTGLPWQELPLPGNRRLGEQYSVGIVPAAGVFRHLRTQPATPADAIYLGVACTGGLGARSLHGVDETVERIATDYFGHDGGYLPTQRCDELLRLRRNVAILHFACHAGRHGLLLSQDGRWTTPADLLDLNIGADILLLTACRAGDFAEHDNNEFLGIVRQVLLVTHARAAIVSDRYVPEVAAVAFGELVVSALTGRRPAGRPWHPPGQRLPAAQAVEWARSQLKDLRSEQVESLLDQIGATSFASYAEPDPEWWRPWYVMGDPNVTVE